MADTRSALQRTLDYITDTDGGLAAGENYLGQTGANLIVIPAPTITVSTGAYTAGDNIGGKQTLANAIRVAGAYSRLRSITILDAGGQAPTGNIIFFSSNPAAATFTDNAAFVASTDIAKIIAVVAVASGNYDVVGGIAMATLEMDIPMAATTGTTLYAAFVTDGTPDLVATTDLSIQYGFERS